MSNLLCYSKLSSFLFCLFQNNYIRIQKGIKIITFLSTNELLNEISDDELQQINKLLKKNNKNNIVINLNGFKIKDLPKPKDVILYGFGRIGRCLARIMLLNGNYPLKLKYIVVRPGMI